MNDSLQLLLLIYSFILVINFIVSIVLYKMHNDILFLILTGVWGGSLINFILQGIFVIPSIAMYISFSTYLFVSLSMYFFSNSVLKNKKSSVLMQVSCLVFLLLGIIVFLISKNYALASSFAAVAIAIPMLVSSYQLWHSDIKTGPKVLSVFLFFNAIHFLDYPILRSHPLGALWGFSIALVLLFAFSTFLPGFILLQISKKYAEGLESEVKLRTIELKDAVEQNKTLVNILCHDLSTPLTVLNFYFDEITLENASPVHLEYGGRAIRSLHKIFKILEKVKDLQAIAFGKKTIERNEVKLLEVIKEVIIDFDKFLKPKNLILNCTNLTNADVVIYGDLEILRNQIFSNLISNAIKFSHKDSNIDIFITNDKNWVYVSIEDKGIGMSPDLLSKIFSLNEKTTRNGTAGETGTGFGLPLVKTCVEIIGASIRAESLTKEGLDSESGSKFIIQFERVVSEGC
ncbi:MAG: HAMP domain-containing sensor histidine kinase [Bacteriovorax sp.]|nr:HAMP domain-containing sensor histidine kinase [Bacteriovorax sp.]